MQPLNTVTRVKQGLVLGMALGMWGLTSQAQTTIGIGTGIMPKYEGAKQYTSRFYPVLNHQNGTFFITPKAEMPALGLQNALTDDWKVGVFASYQWGRKASDAHRLTGTDKIDNYANIGVFSQHQLGDLRVDLTLYQALKKDYGLGVQLGASYPIWQEGLSRLHIGANLAFMNTDAMQTHFGVKPHEVAASQGQLRTHNASGGLKSMTMYGLYSYRLSQSLSLNTAVGVKNLTGDARNSPLTEHKTSVYGSVGVGYSF